MKLKKLFMMFFAVSICVSSQEIPYDRCQDNQLLRIYGDPETRNPDFKSPGGVNPHAYDNIIFIGNGEVFGDGQRPIVKIHGKQYLLMVATSIIGYFKREPSTEWNFLFIPETPVNHRVPAVDLMPVENEVPLKYNRVEISGNSDGTYGVTSWRGERTEKSFVYRDYDKRPATREEIKILLQLVHKYSHDPEGIKRYTVSADGKHLVLK